MSGPSIEHDGLQLRLLGELEVVLEGHVLPLPQSRKTRALLGYLALSGRAHRRDRLCALFWDVADDPRAALRWSLSKLREIVDGRGGKQRVVADREHVALELGQTYVDVLEVQRLLAGELEAAPTANLETARARFRGELLEGLELPDFHAYQAWLLSERRAYRELQRRVLASLLQRTGHQPDQALPLVRELVHLDPSDERARSQLQELLHATGKFREAEEQSRANRRLLHAEPMPAADSGTAQRVVVSSREELPFVGRAAERERVRVWRGAATQELRFALVLGDAGLGKSRLLRELAQDAAGQGARVISAAAHESRPGWPYAPFRELLRALEAASPVLQPLLADDSSSPPTAARA
ncbi:MAG TPA: AAA family ATPase, partial [Polyangiales bacterium]|nr:AAA family ATPase [Polyangiales bacterium]